MLQKKVQAGALQYVVFISVVIALILAAFLFVSHLNQQYRLKNEQYQNLIQTSNTVLALAKKSQLTTGDSIAIPLPNPQKEFYAYVKNQNWGMYQITTAYTAFKNQSFQRTAMLGAVIANKPSLYLQDTKSALLLVGKTKLSGRSYLPQRGVQAGYIARKGYLGSALIYGQQARSKVTLPKLNNRNQLQALCRGIISQDKEAFDWEAVKEIKGIKNYRNSFQKKTQYLHEQGKINLRDIAITGNYIIHSNSEINVSETALLKDVILIAPRIIIQSKTKGQFQAFASESIQIAEGCDFSYPSVFVVSAVQKDKTQIEIQKQQLTIAPRTKLRGSLCFLTDAIENNSFIQLHIATDAKILGDVYCEKNMTLEGTVIGSVYTHSFIVNAYGSIYQNYILNGTIEKLSLSDSFSGLDLEGSQKEIIQYLY